MRPIITVWKYDNGVFLSSDKSIVLLVSKGLDRHPGKAMFSLQSAESVSWWHLFIPVIYLNSVKWVMVNIHKHKSFLSCLWGGNAKHPQQLLICPPEKSTRRTIQPDEFIPIIKSFSSEVSLSLTLPLCACIQRLLFFCKTCHTFHWNQSKRKSFSISSRFISVQQPVFKTPKGTNFSSISYNSLV